MEATVTLILSLFFCIILLLVAILIVCVSRNSVFAVAIAGMSATLIPLCVGAFLPPVLMTAFLLTLAAGYCSGNGQTARRFIRIAFPGVVAIFTICAFFAWWDTTELLKRYPLVSM